MLGIGGAMEDGEARQGAEPGGSRPRELAAAARLAASHGRQLTMAACGATLEDEAPLAGRLQVGLRAETRHLWAPRMTVYDDSTAAAEPWQRATRAPGT